MRYKLEKLGCYMLIIILLPYIVTVFINGPTMVSTTNVEETMLNVETEEMQVSMSLEDYGIGVLAHEIPVDYELEAMKTQAILVRTRLYKSLQETGSDTVLKEEFWTREQMEDAWGLGKFAINYNKFKNAWHETQGQVLMYEDALAYTPFFYLSNGTTRDAKEVLGKEYPYLKIRECPLDVESTEQIQTITLENINAKETEIKILDCDTAGYVLKVKVGNDEISGEEFRNNFGLVSSCFSVQEYEGKIRITTRGVGHGIGLSQYMANKMAEDGKAHQEILAYFFEGCEVKEVVDFVKSME